MKKFPLLDLVWGKYITLLIDDKKDETDLPHRTSIKVKEANQWGGPTVLHDVPEGGLRYIPPMHPNMPRTGVYILLAAAGGIAPVSKEIGMFIADSHEKTALALAKADAAQAAKQAEEKLGAQSVEKTMNDQVKHLEKLQEAASKGMQFPGFSKGRDDMFRRDG